MIAPAHITGVILCGGSARRMGGVQKPLAELFGPPLVAHVWERLAPQVASIVISANSDFDRYREWGDVVVADDTPDGGPLAGMRAALRRITTPFMFCCPGDAPLLDRELVARLSTAMDDRGIDTAVPFDGTRPQHLFLLARAGLALSSSLDDYWRRGERDVRGWLRTRAVATIDASDIAGSFTNINTDDELRELADSMIRDASAP